MKQYLQKTSLRLLLAAFLLSLLPGTVIWGQATQPQGDGGSEGDPYQISTRAHLEWMADQIENHSETFDGKFFKLMNEVDLSSTPWTTPIGSETTSKYFAGVFDGNGYRITGLTIPATGDTPYRGLFGVVGHSGSTTTMIKNLAIEIAESGIHLNPTGNSEVDQIAGGIAGLAQYCTITNCYVTGGGIFCVGDLNNKTVNMGGIAGYGYSLIIKNCYATVDITFSGGIMTYQSLNNGVNIGGITSMGTVSNCFYTGQLKSHATSCTDNNFTFYVGGIAGRGYYLPTTNCLVLSQIIEVTKDGPLGTIYAEAATGTTMSNSNNYVSPETTLNGVTPIYNDDGNGTKWENTTNANPPLSTWLASDNWQANDNFMPTLLTTEGQPFHIAPIINRQGQIVTLIHDAGELAMINTNPTTLEGNYVLVNDIDLTAYIAADGGSWKSIGNNSTPFTGTLDGNGHQITGLTIAEGSSNGENEGGLFGKIGNNDYTGPEIVIKNLGVEIAKSGIYINNNIRSGGGIASECQKCKIENCYVTGGMVYGIGETNQSGLLVLGGIAGKASATIDNCYSTIDIKGEWENPLDGNAEDDLYIGGIVGDIGNGAIKNCFATGTMSAILSNVSDAGFYTHIGGIAAFNTATCTVQNCLATNSEGLTAITDIPASVYINNIMGTQGNAPSFTNNYTLSDIPKTSNVTTSSGSAGTDWDGVSTYPTGIFNNANWQISTSVPENTFPKLCYAGTNTPMPNQPDVMRPYKVDATTPVENGTFTVDCITYAKVDDVVTITTVPSTGYVASLPTVNGISRTGTPIAVTPGADNTYTFTMPAYSVTVTVAFRPIYTVTVDNAVANGYIEVKKADGTPLSPGANSGIERDTQLTITATPTNGYRLKQLTAGSNPISGTTYTVISDITISAEFEKISGGDEEGGGGGSTTPTIYHTVSLPAVEGVTTDPVAGDYEVEAWSSFHFHLTLAEEYNKSEPVVTTSHGETITPSSSDGAYIIKYVRQPLEIFIDGIVKNPAPVANEVTATDVIKVWAAKGNLHIRTATSQTVQVYNLAGLLVKQADISSGDTCWQLPSDIYIIRIDNRRYKVIL